MGGKTETVLLLAQKKLQAPCKASASIAGVPFPADYRAPPKYGSRRRCLFYRTVKNYHFNIIIDNIAEFISIQEYLCEL
jgi:hypothetical protein